MIWMKYMAAIGVCLSLGHGLYYLFKAEDWAESAVKSKGLDGFEATSQIKAMVANYNKTAVRDLIVAAAIGLLLAL
jgi:hypothetical protein